MNIWVKISRNLLLVTTAWVLSTNGALAQTKLDDPTKVRKDIFWNELYAKGGETFYCVKPFINMNRRMAPNYLVPLSQMRRELNCGNARSCEKENESYRHAASDLHNMVPALARVALDRRNSVFGELDSTAKQKFPKLNCDYKSVFNVTEPKDSVKGDVARALLYMNKTYGFNLPLSLQMDVLVEWHKLDPPDANEKARNTRIMSIQGNRNPFIDEPQLVIEAAKSILTSANRQ